MKTLTVYNGRFQPIHIGHLHTIQSALKTSDHVLVTVGSANRPRTAKNPFTYEERVAFIRETLGTAADRVFFAPMNDYLYDDQKWVDQMTQAGQAFARQVGAQEIILTGHHKDASSYYLKLFPHWRLSEQPAYQDDNGLLNATDLRHAFYNELDLERWGPAVKTELMSWKERNKDVFQAMQRENAVVQKYQDALRKGAKEFGYAISVPCVDALVTAGRKILLVQRHQAPGAGLWAMPGGHIDAGETSRQALIRELGEETGLGVPANLFGQGHVFDHPNRSERGWVRTEVFAAELASPELTKVDGQEIRDAQWFDIDTLNPKMMFEDHYDIIQEMRCKTPQVAAQAA